MSLFVHLFGEDGVNKPFGGLERNLKDALKEKSLYLPFHPKKSNYREHRKEKTDSLAMTKFRNRSNCWINQQLFFTFLKGSDNS